MEVYRRPPAGAVRNGHDVLITRQRPAPTDDPGGRSATAAPLPRVRCAREGGRVDQVGKTLMWLLDLLERIPSAFWGVVAGSVFTLTAVILTNRANDRRARAQFQQDQGLRTKERELALKKDIYLSGTEAISAGLRAVAALSNLDLAYDQLMQPYIDKSSAIAKVHIIGNEETLQAVATISSELQGAFMRLIIKRIPLTQMKQHIITTNNKL